MGLCMAMLFQKCLSEIRVFDIEVSSRSNPSVLYRVTGSFESGKISCTCPGFCFKGTCKHTELHLKECGWSSYDSDVEQTQKQADNHICPICKSTTVDMVRGDF